MNHTSHFPHLTYQRGVTLIDALVGSALMLVVFLGIAAAFQLSVEVVTNNKSRAGAIALGNERMEYLKSLSYAQIGVVGGIPAGNVPQIESVSLNGVTYTRRTLVLYSDDPKDGLGASDANSITADYKTIRVEVSWQSQQGARSVELIGRVSPYGVESSVTGGTLSINVVNASSQPVVNAEVRIVNASTSPTISITTYTGTDGNITFIGAPASSNYQITATKTGYSTAQTYAVTGSNPNPTPRHLTVSNNVTTNSSFAIDLLASKNIYTYKQIVATTWTDSFNNEASIATSSSVTISGGDVRLSGGGPYASSGFVESVVIEPTILAGWNDLSWSDSTPASTDIRYSIFDATGGGNTIIPESDLPGNAAGFTASPVDLSALATSTYRALKLRAALTTSNPAATPVLSSWTLGYDFGPEPLPNFAFTMRGAKTIGNSPTVYKYNTTLVSNASSLVSLPSIEWDYYTIGVTSTSTYEIAETCGIQPETLSPGASQTTYVYLTPATTHSLVVDVTNSVGAPIPGVSVQVTRTGYNVTKQTSDCGQAYFGTLVNNTYSIAVTKSGYQSQNISNVTVSGDTTRSVVLQSL